MGKKKNTKKRTGKMIALVVLCLILAVELWVFVVPQMLYKQQGDAAFPDAEVTESPAVIPEATEWAPTEAETEEAAAQETQPVNTGPTLEFPQLIDGGKLKVEMLFQYDGINPDCGDEDATEIASILVTNISGEFLEHAEVTAVMADGPSILFKLTNVPAGKSVMAFSVENHSIDAEPNCLVIECVSSYRPTASAEVDGIEVAVNGTEINLENHSGKDISGITVYCHGLLGTEYFGGITYEYQVESLGADESATIDALECFMGEAEVVRIELNES